MRSTVHGVIIIIKARQTLFIHSDVLSIQSTVVLTWQQRSKILKDVCRGLHSAQPPMLHGDLKPLSLLIMK